MKTMVSTAGGGLAAPVPVPDGLEAGQKAGPWIVERELGRGGMGAVYAVTHDTIGKRAALKVVHNRLLTPSFNPERMLLEARVVNQVGHPNIVDIFETGKLPDGRPYIVMERLEGQPLSDRADEGKILPDQVIGILLQVCDALLAAHAAGIIHRDLKLDNVFLVDNPDDPRSPKVKLLDWGIAKVINQEVRHTVEGQLVGTPQYLAPEQARGGQVSPATDVYSLGVMAYELFLEQLPFEAETSAEIMAMHLRATPPPPSELWPDVPHKLEELLVQMLAKAPDHRPSVLEVARRLEEVRAGLHRRRSENAMVAALPVVPVEPIETTKVPSQAGSKILPPSLSRILSPAGFAPTEAVDQVTTHKRWQFAVGAFALVASAMMILLSRDGDTQSANAESTVPEQVEPAPAPAHEPPTPTVVSDVAIETLEAADAAEPTAEPTPDVAPATTTLPTTRRAPTTRPVPRATTQRSTRTPTVLPRRAAKIDLDGTLDPYR